MSSPTMGTPIEQNSALIGLSSSLTNSFAYADTWGNPSATLISVGGVSSSTLAQVNALPPLSGLANGNIVNTSRYSVAINQTGLYRLEFEVVLDMESIGDGFATSSFGIQATQTLQSGGTVGFDDNNAVFPSLNGRIDGAGTRSVSGTFFSSERTFQARRDSFGNIINSPVEFTITQASSAGVSVVPEPSSIAIFGLMSVGSLAAWRRRRAGERKSAES
ncbi:MAG: PEP-CTERM sorting domain-containing protein [Planctomycetota bacterium]|nr:PEP-CTERM sorting domain-containing protein [Planctomycetota bacterium]